MSTFSRGGRASAWIAIGLLVLALFGSGQRRNAAAEANQQTAAVIGNGTIELGVNDTGDLNASGVGLHYLVNGNEALANGCLCEGWGAGDEFNEVSGWANQSDEGPTGMAVESFTADAETATSVVTIESILRVTHSFHPAPGTQNLYQVDVSVENVSEAAVGKLRYRRVMDWDVDPTAFSEVVTIDTGSVSELVFTSNDGFASADPLSGPSDIGYTGSFVDAGPGDFGALFDFDFGALPAGDVLHFRLFYGAAGSEADATAALTAVGAQAYSFGQPSTADGPALGTPNTFIFAYAAGTGDAENSPPDAVDDSTSVDEGGTVSHLNSEASTVLANDSDVDEDALTVSTTPVAGPSHGSLTLNADGTFSYIHDGSETTSDSFTYEVCDDGEPALCDTATVDVTIQPVNDPPAVDLNGPDGAGRGFSVTFVQGDGPVAIADADAVVSDVDNANLASVTVTISNLLDGAAESLAADTTGTVIETAYNDATGVLILAGSDSVANYSQVLRSVVYDNTASEPDTTPRSVTVVVNDGSVDSAVATASVTITDQFTVFQTEDSGTGSLRRAILNANARPGPDTIVFDVPGTAPHVIQPISALPTITDPVTIDGTTQLRISGAPAVVLDGLNAGTESPGFHVTASSSTVKGLIIRNFGGSGLLLEGGSGNVVQQTYLGVDLTGATERGNGQHGVHVRGGSQDNQVGPDNVIAHNGGAGVRVEGATTSGNTITENAIYANTGAGIEIAEGANQDKTVPQVQGAVGSIVAGLADPGDTIEIFAADVDQGRAFLGTTTADEQGHFEFVGTLAGPKITATATDANGNTSPFSSPVDLEQAIPDTFEPNDDWTQAQLITVDGATASALVAGADAGVEADSLKLNAVTASATITSYVSAPGDVDYYKLAVPQRGSTVTFTLTDLPDDFDLLLFRPTDVTSDTPLDDIPLDDIPLDDIPLDDIPLDDVPLDDIPLDDIPLDDIPLDDIPLDDIPLDDISFHHGTLDEQVSDVVLHAADFYYVAVISHNGNYSPDPYTLRAEVEPPASIPACTRDLPFAGSAGSIYQNPAFSDSDIQTIIVTNKQRMEELYGTSATSSLMSRLEDLADHATVKGLVLPVETDSAVAAAYASWDQNVCDPEAANDVAGTIKDLLRTYFADSAFENLTYVVVAGSDEVIPFRRVQDVVQTSNEHDYRKSAQVEEDSALFASLDQGYILTDDFYVDFEPTDYSGRPLYVANYPIGRLLETPDEIVGQIDYYLSSDGSLDATTSLTVGYDFLTDSSLVISDTLAAQGLSNETLISDTWTAQDFRDAALSQRHDVASLNAHFDHFQFEPGDRTGGLFQSDEIDGSGVFTGTVNFSMGCHAGLNVCDLISTSGPASLDFAQSFARNRAVFVGNTGYGYGDTVAVALTEVIMSNFAQNLGAGTAVPVGQALVDAKQDYAAKNLGFYGPYDEKVLIEATLYGLPMYRVSVPAPSSGGTATAQPTLSGASTEVTNSELHVSASGVISRSYTISPTLEQVDTSDGSYFTTPDGTTQAILYRPLQPRSVLDVSLPTGIDDDAVAHGSLFLGGSYTDVEPFDPVVTMPVSETRRYEPQWIYTGWQPLTLSRINHFRTPAGLLERMVVILGQFLHTDLVDNHVEGVERLYNEVTYEVYYSSADDVTPPTITSVNATRDDSVAALTSGAPYALLQGGSVRFVVQTSDASGVERVVVVYTTGDGTWESVDLTYDADAGEWTGVVTGLMGEVNYMAQAVDGAGNVGRNRAKGLFFSTIPVSAGADRTVNEGAELTFDGAGPAGSTINWDFGDGLTTNGTFTPAHRYRDDGSYQAELVVNNQQGGTGLDTATVTVNNVAPTTSIDETTVPTSGLVCIGEQVQFDADFTDPGVLDTHSAAIDWGDGTVRNKSLTPGSNTVSDSHTYAADGVFTVEACVTDDDDGTGCDTFDVAVHAPSGLAVGQVSAEPANSVALMAELQNASSVPFPAGLPVAFYLDDPDAGGTLIGTTATTAPLGPNGTEVVSVAWNGDTPGKHDVYVVAGDDGSGGNPLGLCGGTLKTSQTVSILDVPLAPAWNLISTYVNPFNTEVEVVQMPIQGQYDVIQSFDGGAESYYPGLPAEVNTLETVDAAHGYWIKTVNSQQSTVNSDQLSVNSEQPTQDARRKTQDATAAMLRIVGTAVASDTPLALEAGWNLISYLPRQSQPVEDALQSVADDFFVALGYEDGALSYYPDLSSEFNTLRTMKPLQGYWLKMQQAGTLQYPTTEGGMNVSRLATETQTLGENERSAAQVISRIRTAEREAGVIPTSTWVNFYGTARLPDGTPLSVGTLVEAVDPDGVVCGATEVTRAGQYGLLACYGDDPNTEVDEGAEPGDVIRLVVAGQVLGTGTWTSHGDRQWVPLGPVEEWKVRLPLILRNSQRTMLQSQAR